METQSYNFSSIKYSDLEELVNIRPKYNPAKFKDWLDYFHDVSDFEHTFLKNLIEKHLLLLTSYQEEDLKAKFIIPILNQVDFMTEEYRDWYDTSLSGTVNEAKIMGFTDYMVAQGLKTPRKPYFFIQEFKPSVPDRDPEVQLLAEMLVAIEKNQATIFRGGYIIGQYWKFVILEKIAENQFEYVVSEAFDSLKLPDLKKIYIILQAVKHNYCKD
jgi:hypothetical protein